MYSDKIIGYYKEGYRRIYDNLLFSLKIYSCDLLMIDVSMILWTPFGRIFSNQRSCPNVTKIYQGIQRNDCSIA
ncbi:MAG: hypothetical protein D8H99_53255 [Streptococcus sp.]|nr:MAG: hypothetical protein D8H99_53255 [Streptococcus sp.]